MSKRKKGLSLEEKRQVMLDIFHESKEVFNLKELENIGAKRGVVSQSIPDVIKSLVDDKLIEQDKIGSGNFFFSFPAAAYLAAQSKVSTLEQTITNEENMIKELEHRLQTLTTERTGSSSSSSGAALQRTNKLSQLEALKGQSLALDKALTVHAENDPAVMDELRKKAQILKISSDRWTDNVYSLRSHLIKKFGREPKEVDKLLGINDSFDYIA